MDEEKIKKIFSIPLTRTTKTAYDKKRKSEGRTSEYVLSKLVEKYVNGEINV